MKPRLRCKYIIKKKKLSAGNSVIMFCRPCLLYFMSEWCMIRCGLMHLVVPLTAYRLDGIRIFPICRQESVSEGSFVLWSTRYKRFLTTAVFCAPLLRKRAQQQPIGWSCVVGCNHTSTSQKVVENLFSRNLDGIYIYIVCLFVFYLRRVCVEHSYNNSKIVETYNTNVSRKHVAHKCQSATSLAR